MKIEIIKETDLIIIKLEGKLDSLGSIEFEKMMQPYQNFKYFLTDFEGIKYLSSAGIRVILKLEKDTRQQNGKLILTGINQVVNQVLSMTGLRSQLSIYATLQEGKVAMQNFKQSETKFTDYSINDCNFKCFQLSDETTSLKYNISSCIESDKESSLKPYSLDELHYSVGIGGIGLNKDDLVNNYNLVITSKNFVGLKPIIEDEQSDFVFTDNDSDLFIYIKEVLSYNTQPNLSIDFKAETSISISEFLDNINKIVSDNKTADYSLFSYVLLANAMNDDEDEIEEKWIIANGILVDRIINPNIDLNQMRNFIESMRIFECSESVCAGEIEIVIKNNKEFSGQHKLLNDLNDLLTYENIKSIECEGNSLNLKSGRIYIFLNDKTEELTQSLSIENLEELQLTDEFEIIVRRIYSDCVSIRLNPLLGGFSARTFQVFGKDKNGQSILPTVLKLSNSKIIKREEENFEKYVKKFILNNATTVMGSFYYGDWGGIRYNFLGITGSSTLRWLRHIYFEKDIDSLYEIFDKVYTQILKPWYGQPQFDSLPLYKDQNPIHFFPSIFDKAKEVFNISADSEMIFIKELNREIVNPYYFLKHQYPKREKEFFKYYKSICHGDLNLQNILLDEKENIYILDFSETKYRNCVSDFARLEPIIKIEYFNIETQEDLNALIDFELALNSVDRIDSKPQFVYHGNDKEVERGYKMILKIRDYANTVSLFEKDIKPYLIAMLEWTLPVVCYMGLNEFRIRYSMIMAALMTEKLYK